jgi:hypothetical protein
MKALKLTNKQNEKLQRVINQDCTEQVFAKVVNGILYIRAIWTEKEPKTYSNGTIGKYTRVNYTVGKRGGCDSSMDLYQPTLNVDSYTKVK